MVLKSLIGAPFIIGRNIMHILLCQDLVKQYTRKSYSPSCLMKIALCKAKETMDCQFIKEMLIALNFPTHFIHIVMTCITSTRYTLMLNGNPTPTFQAKRKLRQGVPLSFLLYVIGMKYLSRIIRSAEDQYGFHPRCKKKRSFHTFASQMT
ncbi:uncharacterized protein LOC130801010 [Amaranthus tricolor]|uniref:uncharacterized protein LOC130801010 n=1 Tax=Amaranthus tricolor TaxID=29722 RepID=UPI002588EC43|nr:uncharacterized protein LOC130801010 [Amaranthus tricolor]